MTIPLPLFANAEGEPDFLLTASVCTLTVLLARVALGVEVYPPLAVALLAPTFGGYLVRSVLGLLFGGQPAPLDANGTVLHQDPDPDDTGDKRLGFRVQ